MGPAFHLLWQCVSFDQWMITWKMLNHSKSSPDYCSQWGKIRENHFFWQRYAIAHKMHHYRAHAVWCPLFSSCHHIHGSATLVLSKLTSKLLWHWRPEVHKRGYSGDHQCHRWLQASLPSLGWGRLADRGSERGCFPWDHPGWQHLHVTKTLFRSNSPAYWKWKFK